METPQELHPTGNESGVTRMLRDGNREPLARAKETLKDRLLSKMRAEVLDDLADTERVVEETLGEAPVAEAVESVREAFQARLRNHVYQEAVDELLREDVDVSLPDGAEVAALDAMKTAIKKQLQDDLRTEAVNELLREDVDVSLSDGAEVAALDAIKTAIKKQLQDDLRTKAVNELCQVGTEDLSGQDIPELESLKESLKSRLLDDLRMQALDEIRAHGVASFDASEAPSEAASALEGVKEAFKTRMLDRLLQQAIDEIGDEVGDATNTLLSRAEKEEWVERAEEIPVDVPEENDVEMTLEWTDDPIEAPEDPSELIDMHFWEEGDALANTLDAANDALQEPGQQAEGEGSSAGFFLPGENDLTAVPGAVSEIDSRSDPAHVVQMQPEIDTASGQAEEEALTDEEPYEEAVYYLYGIHSYAEAEPGGSLPEAGIDPSFPLVLVSEESIHAIVSKVPSEVFGEAGFTEHLKDPDWMSQQTRAHEALIEQLTATDGFHAFHPVPPCTIYESEAEIRSLLSKVYHLDALERLNGRSEWTLELFRNRETLHQRVVENSDAIQDLMSEIRSKPKGGAQSIKKKMVAAIQEEMAMVTDECTRNVHERLLTLADDAELGTMDDVLDEDRGDMLLSASYLVSDEHAEAVQDVVHSLRDQYGGLGFVMVLTGPRPPALLDQLLPIDEDG